MPRSLPCLSAVVLALIAMLGAQAAEPMTGQAFVLGGQGLSPGAIRPAGPRGENAALPLQGYLHNVLARRQTEFKRDRRALPSVNTQGVFFARQRPVRIHFVLTVEGKQIEDKLDTTLREMFAAFDRDKDGSLNAYETSLLFTRQDMAQIMAGGYAIRYTYRNDAAINMTPSLELLDQDGDGRVNFEECAAFYSVESSKYLNLTALQNYGYADTLSPEVFARLDRNKDGQLDEEELKDAPKLLPLLDSDEDECLSMMEFLSTPIAQATAVPIGQGAMPAMPAMPGIGGVRTAAPPADLLKLHANDGPADLIAQIMKKYDKDDDFALSPKELAFEPAVFARWDSNKDGKLSAKELEAWRCGPPDVIVKLNYATKDQDCWAKIELGQAAREGLSIPDSNSYHRVTLRVHSQNLEFGVSRPVDYPGAMPVGGNPYFYNFPMGREFLLESDLATPQMQFFRLSFDIADFNLDGKLTRAEFERYFQIQGSLRHCACSLQHLTRIPHLFQLADTNSDGKLSQRELRGIYQTLQPLEPDGGKFITKAILQPAVFLRFGPTWVVQQDQTPFGYISGPKQSQGATSTPGPLWFRKMDRNGDGELSRFEFLGSRDDFEALDSNKDGIISLQEAEAFDKKHRTSADKKQARVVLGFSSVFTL